MKIARTEISKLELDKIVESLNLTEIKISYEDIPTPIRNKLYVFEVEGKIKLFRNNTPFVEYLINRLEIAMEAEKERNNENRT